MNYSEEEIKKLAEEYTSSFHDTWPDEWDYEKQEPAAIGYAHDAFINGFRKAQELYEQKLKEQLQMINEMYCSK